MSPRSIDTALDLLKAGHFKDSPEMHEAHDMCQEHEGDILFDWVHALIHRIEGDNANANYWYRRAGQSRHTGTISEEWQVIRETVQNA